jgi:hypothetical protein
MHTLRHRPGPGEGARKQARMRAPSGLFAGPAARSARGCVENAAAHDRKPGGAGTLNGSAPTRSARQLLCALPADPRTDDLLITSRNDSASCSLYQHQHQRGWPHHAPCSPPIISISHHEPHHALSVRPPAQHDRPRPGGSATRGCCDSSACWLPGWRGAPFVEQPGLRERPDMFVMPVIFPSISTSLCGGLPIELEASRCPFPTRV